MKAKSELTPVNCLAVHNTSDLILTGLDNGEIEVIDIKSGAVVNVLKGHESGVADIQTNCTISNSKFFTAASDGKVKVWDTRKYECLSEVQAHRAKYGDAGLALCGLLSMNMIATGNPLLILGGADSVINLYELNEHF